MYIYRVEDRIGNGYIGRDSVLRGRTGRRARAGGPGAGWAEWKPCAESWVPGGIQSSAGGPGGGRTLNFETKSLRPRVRVSLNPSVVTCSNVISFPNTLVIVWSLKSQSLWSLCVCGCEGCRVHGVNTASWNQELEAGALAVKSGNKYIYFTTPCLLQYLQVFSRSRRSRWVFSMSSPGLSWEL